MDMNETKEILYHDRIAEAYEGLLGEEFMNRQQERIHWICEKAGNGRILDVGCSQGICPLILGKNGAEATGVDIDPDAIRYAVDHLLSEPLEVQSRVRYYCTDFLTMELPEGHYDTVLLTEILEHLEDPQSFLNKAFLLIRDGGKMVVTVPFGINAYKDHKRTYYLAELYEQISACLTITDIEFFDGWIGFLAEKNSANVEAVFPDIHLISREEAAFFGVEQKIRERWREAEKSNRGLNKQVQQLTNKLTETEESEAASRSRVLELEQHLQTCQKDMEARTAAARAAEAELQAALRNKEEELTAQAEAAKAAEAELQAALRGREEELTAQAEAAKAAEAEWQATLRGCEEQLQSKAADLERAREVLDLRDSELQNTKSQLKTTIAKLKKTESDVSARAKELKETSDKLRLAEEREAQQKKKYGQYSSELYQTRRKLAVADDDRAELRKKLASTEREHQELLETPAGHRAYLRLLKKKFRTVRRAEKADRRAYEGSLLRRIAKKSPFLVRIVKKIRSRNPESEFLFLKASRSDFVRRADAYAPPKKPASDIVKRKPAPTQAMHKELPPAPAEKAINAQKQANLPKNRVMTKEQEHFLDSLMPMIRALPESNGSRYFEKSDLRIGIICDEFFFDSINAAAEFVPLEPTNWSEELPSVDLLLIVSLWRGLHEEWKGVANINRKDNKLASTVHEMIAEGKRRGIPIVFYSKEDPPNYERFIEYAKECDYIFTTAEECLVDYVRDTGNPEPKVLRFSINPLFHNPIGFRKFEKEKLVLFSGSWMAKYPDRCKDMGMLFDGVLSSNYGLHIIDRNYPSNNNYNFPLKYFPYVSPPVDHATLQKLHKIFDWAINTNSVQFSKTMFANRAYELQAAGVLLLSNYSLGVNSLLPNVFMAFSSEEVRDILNAYTPEEIYERQIAGIRSVMRNDTCFDRMDELFEAIGIGRQQKARRIAVIGDTADPEVAASFARQTFPEAVLLAPETVTDEVLRDYDMVAFFGPGMRYGEFYLEDMANGFKYTASDYITKDAYCEGGQLHAGVEHDYVTGMGSRYRTLFWREAFSAKTLTELADGMELPNGYSIDHFNYDACPAAISPEKRTAPYKLSVVVPVYNNGPHLYGKCFSSLRRSSIFHDMEIIMVDDGSTDGVTPKYISYLASRYPNIRTYFFEKGGSGSASRPRNKGVEMASSEYLTFLDPDNEASEDGYAKLLAATESGKYELIIGGHLKAGLAIGQFGGIKPVTYPENSPDVVRRMKFPTISIQATLIRRALITENGLEQVPGAAGQDTLFCWQLLQSAKSLRFLDITAHIYFAATAGSVTNTITANYFRKLWLLQQPKLEWLQDSGNLEAFMEDKYAYYTDNLIFKNLARIQQGDECEATEIVWNYIQLYAPFFHGKDKMIDCFSELCEREAFPEALEYVKGCFSPKTAEGNS